MKAPRYWFPVRPARDGWGWGMPVTWEGWLAYLVFIGSLVGGTIVLVPYGQWVTIAYACALGALFLGVLLWKGEPQGNRDERSP